MNHVRRLSRFARETHQPLLVVVSGRVRDSALSRSLSKLGDVTYERDAASALARASRQHAPSVVLIEGAAPPELRSGPMLVLYERVTGMEAITTWHLVAVVCVIVLMCLFVTLV